MKIKPINPIARAMFRLRKPKQVIPNKKKNYVPDIDDFDDAYIDMRTGEICSHDDDIDPKDDPHDDMMPHPIPIPKPKPPKEK